MRRLIAILGVIAAICAVVAFYRGGGGEEREKVTYEENDGYSVKEGVGNEGDDSGHPEADELACEGIDEDRDGEENGTLSEIMSEVPNKAQVSMDNKGVIKSDNSVREVIFEDKGITITPKTDPAVYTDSLEDVYEGEDYFRYQLSSISIGDKILFDANSDTKGEPELNESMVSYALPNSMEEAYITNDKGVEQVFILNEPLNPNEDLIIKGNIYTNFNSYFRESSEGIRFVGKNGSILYGNVTVIDTSHQLHEAILNLKDNTIDI